MMGHLFTATRDTRDPELCLEAILTETDNNQNARIATMDRQERSIDVTVGRVGRSHCLQGKDITGKRRSYE